MAKIKLADIIPANLMEDFIKEVEEILEKRKGEEKKPADEKLKADIKAWAEHNKL
jgi:hypothetical protein